MADSTAIRKWRSLVHVVDIDRGVYRWDAHVVAYVPAWNPRKRVIFPLLCVAPHLHSAVKPGAYLIAMVNIGAFSAEDLRFSDFELAPDPVPEEDI